ncbi:MAG: cation transporter, partial [bacterium]|nr:cation transporter [bacterium]
MGAGHDHKPGQANGARLAVALALTLTFLVAEVIAGVMFNSLALLSDAAHMFTDAAALAIALAAIKIGARKPDDRRSFG